MRALETPTLLVVCGPNASGKTRLAVALACSLDGEIISADSRQVYRGMNIGTGKDLEEYATPSGSVPCHLADIADPSEIYTLHHYVQDFHRVFAEIRARGHLPIVAGGTGLYIEAVLKGYRISQVPENAALRERLMSRDKEELESELAHLAPAMFARTDRSSKKRIVRALEIVYHDPQGGLPDQTGRPPGLEPLVLAIGLPRPVLHERIHRRLLERLDEGMVEEVRNLMRAGVSYERMAMLGLEYRHIARHLRGELSYEEMVEVLEREIRRLAKRQMTWFRGMQRRGIAVHWLEETDPAQALAIARRHGLGPVDKPSP